METCAEISKMLSQAVEKICKGTDTADAFIDFMEGFVDAEEFLDYFMATWYPRIGNFLLATWTLTQNISQTLFSALVKMILLHPHRTVLTRYVDACSENSSSCQPRDLCSDGVLSQAVEA